MSKKRLKSIRTAAFHAQAGRCYYCGLPMWLASPSEPGPEASKAYSAQCTAEHLVARQDGGKDLASNIVAACCLCNQRRHQRSAGALAPDSYRAWVQRQVAKGKWLPYGVR